MKRLATLLLAATLLSGCASVREGASRLWPFGGGGEAERKSPNDGRVSILTFDTAVTPDPAAAAQPFLLPPAAELANWPAPGGPVSNAPGHVKADGPLAQAWRRGAGEGSARDRALTSSPIVADGRIFVLDAGVTVRAFDAATGAPVWSQNLRPRREGRGRDRDPRALPGGIAFADGRVFASTGWGEVVALDAATGAQAWRARNPSPIHTAPVAANGRVFVVSTDSEILAFDAATGATQWTFQAIAEPARMLSSPSPAVQGDVVVAPFASGELVALLAANGRRLWTDALTRTSRVTSLSAINDIAGRPAIAGGVVFAASQSGVLAAVDLRTGQRLWARTIGSIQTPMVAGDHVFVVTTDSQVVCLERATGVVRWVRELRRFEDVEDRKGRVVWSGPVLASNRLVLASSRGDIAVLNPADGATVRELRADGPVYIAPIVADDTVFVLSDTGSLSAFR